MKTLVSEATIDAVNFLCAPWSRVAKSIWIERGVEIDLDLSEDKDLTIEERLIAEAAISIFDAESSVRLQVLAALDDKDYERVLNALRIVRRSADISALDVGDYVRVITYKKLLALAERKGLRPQMFEDIAFPKYPFIKELIPYCGEELKVLSVLDGALELEVGDEEWIFPHEWISAKVER